MKTDDQNLPKEPLLSGDLSAALIDERDIPEEERVLRSIVKGATNASAVLDSIVDQWNSYQHGGLNE